MNPELARQLALKEMMSWGLEEWKFVWSRAVRQFGLCDRRKQTIRLSRTLTELSPKSEVLDTIRHEIAHALAGPRDGHNQRWKQECAKVGWRQRLV